MCMCELNGRVDRMDVCEKVLKLILTVIPYHKNVICVAKPNGWLNRILNMQMFIYMYIYIVIFFLLSTVNTII